MNQYPDVIDALAAVGSNNDGFVIPPRTPVYTLSWNTITDIGIRFRFTPSQPWITARAGDTYTFSPPVQTGVYLDFTTPLGPNPTCTIVVSTTPCGLTVNPR